MKHTVLVTKVPKMAQDDNTAVTGKEFMSTLIQDLVRLALLKDGGTLS